MKKVNRIDIQQSVTDSIIDLIESGGLLPWQCPWTKTGEKSLPYNWLTESREMPSPERNQAAKRFLNRLGMGWIAGSRLRLYIRSFTESHLRL
jgi:N-terminal domain of anti-restriction factor ArdC